MAIPSDEVRKLLDEEWLCEAAHRRHCWERPRRHVVLMPVI